MTKFRFNRGSFEESMANAVMAFNKDHLLGMIRQTVRMPELAFATVDDIVFRDTGPESRNGWANSYLVLICGYPMGFSDGNFSDTQEEEVGPVDETLLVNTVIAKAEAEYNIRVMAVRIMGSHLWGTANGTSDYDIQFVYVRPLTDYLGFLPHKQIRYEEAVVVDGVGAHIDVMGYELTRFMQMMSKTDMMAAQFLYAQPLTGVSESLGMAEIRNMFDRTAQPNILIRKYLGHAKSSFYVNATGPKTNRMALLMLAFALQVRCLGYLKELDLTTACDLFLPTLRITRTADGQIVGFDRAQFDKILAATDEWDLSYPHRSDEELEEINTKAKALVRRYADTTSWS